MSCRPCDSLLGAGATPAKPTGPSAAPGTAPINTARVRTTKERHGRQQGEVARGEADDAVAGQRSS